MASLIDHYAHTMHGATKIVTDCWNVVHGLPV